MIQILLTVGIAILFNNKASDKGHNKWLWILIGSGSFLLPGYLFSSSILEYYMDNKIITFIDSELKLYIAYLVLSLILGLIAALIAYILLIRQPEIEKNSDLLDSNQD